MKGRKPLTTPVKSQASPWQKLTENQEAMGITADKFTSRNQLKIRSITLLAKTINTRLSLHDATRELKLTAILLRIATILQQRMDCRPKGINWLQQVLSWDQGSLVCDCYEGAMILLLNS